MAMYPGQRQLENVLARVESQTISNYQKGSPTPWDPTVDHFQERGGYAPETAAALGLTAMLGSNIRTDTSDIRAESREIPQSSRRSFLRNTGLVAAGMAVAGGLPFSDDATAQQTYSFPPGAMAAVADLAQHTSAPVHAYFELKEALDESYNFSGGKLDVYKPVDGGLQLEAELDLSHDGRADLSVDAYERYVLHFYDNTGQNRWADRWELAFTEPREDGDNVYNPIRTLALNNTQYLSNMQMRWAQLKHTSSTMLSTEFIQEGIRFPYNTTGFPITPKIVIDWTDESNPYSMKNWAPPVGESIEDLEAMIDNFGDFFPDRSGVVIEKSTNLSYVNRLRNNISSRNHDPRDDYTLLISRGGAEHTGNNTIVPHYIWKSGVILPDGTRTPDGRRVAHNAIMQSWLALSTNKTVKLKHLRQDLANTLGGLIGDIPDEEMPLSPWQQLMDQTNHPDEAHASDYLMAGGHDIADSGAEWQFEINGTMHTGIHQLPLSYRSIDNIVIKTDHLSPITPQGSSTGEDQYTLNLHNGRFVATAEYTDFDGNSGRAHKIQLEPVMQGTDHSGAFWFFGPNNIEMLVKVLDACNIESNKFWVFASGLTNVGVHLRVVDTFTGQSREYTTPVGPAFAPIQDTSAFDTCDAGPD